MRYIKEYNQFNKENTEHVNLLKDMFLDIADNDFQVKVDESKRGNIRVYIENRQDNERKSFKFDEIFKIIFNQVIDYMNEMGYEYNIVGYTSKVLYPSLKYQNGDLISIHGDKVDYFEEIVLIFKKDTPPALAALFENIHPFKNIENNIYEIFLELTDKDIEVTIHSHPTFGVMMIEDPLRRPLEKDKDLVNSLLALKSYLESEGMKIDEMVARNEIFSAAGRTHYYIKVESDSLFETDASGEFLYPIKKSIYKIELEYSFDKSLT